MANLNGETDTGVQRVQSFLRKRLPDSRLTVESLLPNYQPLILMWLKHLVAAFAFSNGDTSRSYDALYGGFKKYYASKRPQLDTVDLSFVFCVHPNLPNLDEFCSAIETDVYFCRKFVIPIELSLDHSFARLPFLPLTPIHGGSRRPPSAQTLLRQRNVHATLARFLTVPHQRGPENITSDCLNGEFGDPPTLSTTADLAASELGTEPVSEAVRLTSLTIENFRAYKQSRRFDLSAAVTVLYGANGLGKTSFFDAIDFAATGGIGRLALRPSTGRFEKVATHLDGNPKDGIVSLKYTLNDVHHEVIRPVSSAMHARLDGLPRERKAILAGITGGGGTRLDRIDHLVSLFRATHLFGEEHQELAKEFDRNCTLPEHVVSHMLAFEDYVTVSRKVSSICEILRQEIQESQHSIADLSSEIRENAESLDRLGRAAEEYTEPAVLTHAIAALRRRLHDAGISVQPEESDRMFVRACRTAIHEAYLEGQARVARLEAIVERVRLFLVGGPAGP